MATVSRQRYYDLVYQGQVTDIDPEDALNIIRKTVRPESDVFIFAIERLVAVAPMTIDLTAPVGLEEVGRFFG
jgi:hypothetical protein